MKLLTLRSLPLKLAALLLLGVPARALDFQYSFVNTDGVGTTLGSVVTGTIEDLVDDSSNFQPVTVTLDSISGPDGLGFAPYSWTSSGQFHVSAGVLSFVQWSANDGVLGIDLNTDAGGRGLVFPSGPFVPFYRNGTPTITFTPKASTPVPDGASHSLLLLAGSLAGLTILRRRAQAGASF